MKKKLLIGLLLVVGSIVLGLIVLRIWISQEFSKLESDDPIVWESAIEQFEQLDRENPPPNDAVLFVGSSSIRFWRNLKTDMEPIPVIQRGFGGAKLRDVIHYADRIIFPYEPKAIVLSVGTNDITGRKNDKSPEQILNDFKELAELIERKLPQCIVYYLSITPTSARWTVWPEAERANTLIARYITTKPNFHFIDTSHLFKDAHQGPNRFFLWWDGTHLNKAGYSVWASLVKARLLQDVIHPDGNFMDVNKDHLNRTTMCTIVWKYTVSSENQLQFEKEYGKGGKWWQYFSNDPDYLGSFLYKNELFQKQDGKQEYILLDKWTSMEAYENFKVTHKQEYEQLGKDFEKLFAEEVRVGAFSSSE